MYIFRFNATIFNNLRLCKQRVTLMCLQLYLLCVVVAAPSYTIVGGITIIVCWILQTRKMKDEKCICHDCPKGGFMMYICLLHVCRNVAVQRTIATSSCRYSTTFLSNILPTLFCKLKMAATILWRLPRCYLQTFLTASDKKSLKITKG
jgi:hypothetical protein